MMRHQLKYNFGIYCNNLIRLNETELIWRVQAIQQNTIFSNNFKYLSQPVSINTAKKFK